MFEELEEENVDVSPDSPDRAIVWAIHTRGEANLTPEEAWAILHERYPDDPRFLFLNAYAELGESRREGAARGADGLWGVGYLLKKLERVVARASAELHPQLRDMLLFGATLFATAKDEDRQTLAELRVKIGATDEAEPKRDDRDRAGLRLRRFEREVVKELHDRTEDNKPLGVRAATVAPPGNDWAAAVADTSKSRRKYNATERFARGDLVEHPKFGVGVVTGTEPGKAVILFESGVRKLVAGA